jgi:hypothetical protein
MLCYAVQEGAIRRLEDALEDLGDAKEKAEANEVAAREHAAKCEGMLQFVEREVESVKSLFAEKERTLQAEQSMAWHGMA